MQLAEPAVIPGPVRRGSENELAVFFLMEQFFFSFFPLFLVRGTCRESLRLASSTDPREGDSDRRRESRPGSAALTALSLRSCVWGGSTAQRGCRAETVRDERARKAQGPGGAPAAPRRHVTPQTRPSPGRSS